MRQEEGSGKGFGWDLLKESPQVPPELAGWPTNLPQIRASELPK